MNAVVTKSREIYLGLSDLLNKLEPLALLGARLLVARVFWMSGLGKVNTVDFLGLRLPTFDMQGSTYYLFRSEFFPDLSPGLAKLAAIGAATGELTLPLLLVFGIFTRVGALGLLVMTLVIQIFVFPDVWWSVHAWWAAILFILIAKGPGAISLDNVLGLTRKSAPQE